MVNWSQIQLVNCENTINDFSKQWKYLSWWASHSWYVPIFLDVSKCKFMSYFYTCCILTNAIQKIKRLVLQLEAIEAQTKEEKSSRVTKPLIKDLSSEYFNCHIKLGKTWNVFFFKLFFLKDSFFMQPNADDTSLEWHKFKF